MTQISIHRYRQFLFLVSGLGGLLYGIDVGIIGGALPYLEATSGLSPSQLSAIVAAVLLGSVFSTLFAGMLADWMGRRPLMVLSGCTFVLSIPIIAWSQHFTSLAAGRLLQGMSGGLIGVVVPLYLAECLPAENRGRGTAVFQWLLTLGISVAALIGIYFSYRVAQVAQLGNATTLFAFKDHAWRQIFWMSLPPGILFTIGSCLVAESPRWLLANRTRQQALAALERSRSPQAAAEELAEMERNNAESAQAGTATRRSEPLLVRKYIVPFVLACLILAFNQLTGVNSIIGYNTNILIQSGLSDLAAHWGYFIFTAVNFLATIIGVVLVDRSGRKVLLGTGTGGLVVVLIVIAVLFGQTENRMVDVRDALQSMAKPGSPALHFTSREAQALAQLAPASAAVDPAHATLQIIYSCGDFVASTDVVRSDDPAQPALSVSRDTCLPRNAVESLFKNPFGSLSRSVHAPLKIEKASLGPIPDRTHGLYIAAALCVFIAFFAIGPGVCVWLALSELMPTRIRSNGMSIALLINQTVSTLIAAFFLPAVARFGYAHLFLAFAVCTLAYFLTSVFLLPETKGKTLEEIEAHFDAR